MSHLSSQYPNRPAAVLIGIDSLQGLQAARILAHRKVPVIALAKDPGHYCARTRVCQKIIKSQTKNDDLIKTLVHLGPQLRTKGVLFPCEDANVKLVSMHREKLKRWYHIILPAADIVETLISKDSFYEYAQNNGFKVPRTRVLKKLKEIKRICRELNFPCIMKPTLSADPDWEHNSMHKAFKVSSAEELAVLYKHYRKWADTFIVQEVVEGPDTNHFSCNCYFDKESKPIVTFVTRKLRQWPPITGQGCLGEECNNPVVLSETLRLFKSVNYRGLGYLEMKRDARTGDYFMIEPNIGRPTGRSATTEAGGVELLYVMYCEAIGEPLPYIQPQKYAGVKWVYLRQDLQAAVLKWLQNDLSFAQWWRSYRGHKTFALFSWSDPAPFIRDVMRVLRVMLSHNQRKKRRYQDQIV